MIFDPAYEREAMHYGSVYTKLLAQKECLGKFGNFTNLIEQIYSNMEAFQSWDDIEHVKHDIAWYFTLTSNGDVPQPGKMAHFDAVQILDDPDFVKRLVFVGSNECYNEDVQRFARLFGISESYLQKYPVLHLRKPLNASTNKTSLSKEARLNIEVYFQHDFEVLQRLSTLGLIKCHKLIDQANLY